MSKQLKETIKKVSKRLKIDVMNYGKTEEVVDVKSLKFCRQSFRNLASRQEKTFKTSNKIGYLHTLKQPSGTNGYFNILKQKVEAEIMNSQPSEMMKKGRIPCISCTNCTCGEVCSCGRRILQEEKRDFIDTLSQCMENLHRSSRTLMHQFTRDALKLKTSYLKSKKVACI